MVESRGADAPMSITEARIRTGLDDLVDEAAERCRRRAGRRTAGVNLEFLLAEIRERVRVVVIESAVNRNAVELVTDLRIRRATDVEDLAEAVVADRTR